MQRKERLAGTLTRHNRPLISYLAGLGFDGGTITKVTPWCNKLEHDARLWLARGGYSSRGSLNKRDARWLLKHELSKLEGGAR